MTLDYCGGAGVVASGPGLAHPDPSAAGSQVVISGDGGATGSVAAAGGASALTGGMAGASALTSGIASGAMETSGIGASAPTAGGVTVPGRVVMLGAITARPVG